MNKRTTEAFKEWLKASKRVESEPPTKLAVEFARRAFAAGVNWNRTA